MKNETKIASYLWFQGHGWGGEAITEKAKYLNVGDSSPFMDLNL